MHKRLALVSLFVTTGALAVACGSDDSGGPPGGGGTGGTPGATGGAPGATGGVPGATGGTPGATGGTPSATGGAPPSGDPYTTTDCPGETPTPGVTDSFPSCDTICGPPARCVTVSLVDNLAPGRASLLPDCPDDGAGAAGKCVPVPIGEALGTFQFKGCTDILGGAGFCVPRCIAELVSPTGAPALQQDVCGTAEVCAPCTDPTNNNMPTGACDSYCGG